MLRGIVFIFPFVCSFVRDSVPFVKLLQSFTLKFFKWGISHQPLIRKHSYLDHRYLGGSAFIPWLLTPVSMLRGGARGQKTRIPLKSVFLLFLLWKQLIESIWPDVDLKINAGHCDLYFMVHRFCVILKTIWDMNILWDYGSVWSSIWPQNKCMSLWPIFHGPVILPYVSKTIWWMTVIFSDNETGWPKLWHQNKYR